MLPAPWRSGFFLDGGGWVEAQQSDGNVRRSSGNELDLGSEGFERLPAAFNNLSLEKL